MPVVLQSDVSSDNFFRHVGVWRMPTINREDGRWKMEGRSFDLLSQIVGEEITFKIREGYNPYLLSSIS